MGLKSQAAEGQFAMQAPQALHFLASTLGQVPSSTMLRAPVGQTSMHLPDAQQASQFVVEQ